jgi:hypothetical protein
LRVRTWKSGDEANKEPSLGTFFHNRGEGMHM